MRIATVLLGCMVLAAGEPKTVRYGVAGLRSPVEIRIDRWGVPHIYAKSRMDAYFAQGFNAARDRLWQIDVWRKRGLGRLAEDLGPDYLAQDEACRRFLFRGDLNAEWRAYGPEGRMAVTAFVAGINAYVDRVLAGKAPLPMEFTLLDTRPARWATEDVVRIRIHGLSGNLPQEVARAQTLCRGGAVAESLRRTLEPAWTPKVAAGLDPCAISSEVLRPYLLARAEPTFSAPRSAHTSEQVLQETLDRPVCASNAMAVSGARSATGRPLLASDPHRDFTLPSVRYLAHLSAPGLDAIGAGEPFMPGVSIGHNGHIALGLTYHGLDQEDLYVYETQPGDGNRYWYQGRWEPFQVLQEPFAVKGQAARTVSLKFTHHGPVLFEDPANRRAYALRAAWLEPGMVPYLSSLAYMRATDWRSFLAVVDTHGMPGANFTYADRDGHIGLAPSGLFPRRKGWDGLLPAPGDGRYEWEGWMGGPQLVRVLDPAEGWVATANERNLPDAYPYEDRQPGFEWADRFRHQRLVEVLTQNPRVTVADLQALQLDSLSLAARRLVRLLEAPGPEEREPWAEAARRLRAWDGSMAVASPEAAVLGVWLHKYLRAAVVRWVLTPRAAAVVGDGDLTAILTLLESPDARLGPDPLHARREAMRESLKAAVAELQTRLGPSMDEWNWGQLHQLRLLHPLSERVSPEVRAKVDPPSRAVSGSHETVGRASFRNPDFSLSTGASVRLVMDVGDWDRSTAINVPGQSGDPASPHYQDLLTPWSRGEQFPLLYSRRAVVQATEQVLWLVPAAKPGRRKS